MPGDRPAQKAESRRPRPTGRLIIPASARMVSNGAGYLLPAGHLVRVSTDRELAPQWPGQAASLVRAALGDADGGVLAVEVTGGQDDDEVIDALAAEMRPRMGDPVVLLIGTHRVPTT
jgi:hypothetical protein